MIVAMLNGETIVQTEADPLGFRSNSYPTSFGSPRFNRDACQTVLADLIKIVQVAEREGHYVEDLQLVVSTSGAYIVDPLRVSTAAELFLDENNRPASNAGALVNQNYQKLAQLILALWRVYRDTE